MRLRIEDVLKATDGRLITLNKKIKTSGFSIDSRTIKKHETFIAIKGKRLNGHNFIFQAYKKGVRSFIVSDSNFKKEKLKDSTLIKVNKTTNALGQIAYLKRKLSCASVIGVTGSCGKTTTKDMISEILGDSYKVLKNNGTQNNEFGLPLTLLKLKPNHEIAVLEMGMNHPGEIKMLNNIAQADIGVVTSIYPVHLKYLKDIKSVAKAKWELIESLRGKKIAVLNNDDENLRPLFKKFKGGRIITFGIKQKSDFKASDIKIKKESLSFKLNEKYKITLNLLGVFNIYNALAAIAVSSIFKKVKYKSIKKTLFSFKPPPMRMERLKYKGITIIDDGYNSNPESLALAARTLSDYSDKGKKIIVCCDMLELGAQSKQFHLKIGRLIAKLGIDYLITMGKYARWIHEGALKEGIARERLKHTEESRQAGQFLSEIAGRSDTILLKGSRLMKTEEIIKCFMKSYTR